MPFDDYSPTSTPAPHVTSKTKTKKWVNKKDPTSWNKKYKPSRAELQGRIMDYYTNREHARGSARGAGWGAVGGGAAGALLGGGAGYGLTRDAELGAYSGAVGGMLGSLVGVGVGSHFGGKRGMKRGQARGKHITSLIPKKGGHVSALASQEKRAAKRFFAQHKNLKKHQNTPYHQDFKYKTKTTTTKVVHEPNEVPGSMVPPKAKIQVKHDKKKGKRRVVAPVKTGYAKHGYYREDIIEGIIGKAVRTVTGKRRRINRDVRAAIETSKDARFAHRKSGHVKKFYRGKSPRNSGINLTGAQEKAEFRNWKKNNKAFARVLKREERQNPNRVDPTEHMLNRIFGKKTQPINQQG